MSSQTLSSPTAVESGRKELVPYEVLHNWSFQDQLLVLGWAFGEWKEWADTNMNSIDTLPATFLLFLLLQVHSEGFLVEEDGNAQIRRVLLSDVTGEAARAFLRYLYAADADIPAEVVPQVGALAARFVSWVCFGSLLAFRPQTDPTQTPQLGVFSCRFSALKFHSPLLYSIIALIFSTSLSSGCVFVRFPFSVSIYHTFSKSFVSGSVLTADVVSDDKHA